jgi:hypothetical protein
MISIREPLIINFAGPLQTIPIDTLQYIRSARAVKIPYHDLRLDNKKYWYRWYLCRLSTLRPHFAVKHLRHQNRL